MDLSALLLDLDSFTAGRADGTSKTFSSTATDDLAVTSQLKMKRAMQMFSGSSVRTLVQEAEGGGEEGNEKEKVRTLTRACDTTAYHTHTYTHHPGATNNVFHYLNPKHKHAAPLCMAHMCMANMTPTLP